MGNSYKHTVRTNQTMYMFDFLPGGGGVLGNSKFFMAPSLPWCIRRSRSSRCPSNVGPGVRLVSLGLVLRPLASPGPDREFLALWPVFWGADSEFEVRFSKFGHLASFKMYTNSTNSNFESFRRFLSTNFTTGGYPIRSHQISMTFAANES